MAIQAAIFDMDGLMLHTEPLYREAWQQASAECGHPLTDAMYVRLAGLRRTDAERLLQDEFGARFSMDAFRAACENAEAAVFGREAPSKKPGLESLLALLDARGTPKAVATSTVRETAAAQLAAAGLLERFDAIATGDEVANGKPSPDLFLLAAERLGLDASVCLVLEDSEAGVVAARRAGMLVYMVPDGALTAEAERFADAIFPSLAEVACHLEREKG